MTFRKVLKKYISICLRDRRNYFWGLLLLIVSTVLIKIIPLLYGQITESLLGGVFEQAIVLVFLLLVVKVSGEMIRIASSQSIDKVLLAAFENSRIEYITALQNMDYDYHTGKSSGSLISLAKRGESAIFSALIEVNAIAFAGLVEFVIAIIALSAISLALGGIMVALLLVSIVAGYFLIQNNVRKRKISNAEDDKITALTVDNLVGFETVKLFAKEEFERGRFRKAYIPWHKAQINYIITFRLIDAAVSALSSLAIVASLLVAIHLVQSSAISVGAAVASFVYVFGLGNSMRDIIFHVREIAKNYTDLEKYFETMSLVPKVQDPTNPADSRIIQGKIEFRDLHFKYPKGNVVLHDLNLTIAKGETVALVGESGSGKTTFGRLLLRFYDVSAGELLFDGVNIRDFAQSELRAKIGVVPQEPVLFNDSIRYNISYGQANATDEEVYEAARKARLHDFVLSLPDGYDTIVGERGIKLSGGQKQRLAIARVILENPPIVLFDEATSQLDSATEKEVQAAFENLTRHKTTIIIAHRLSTVKNADRILVFDKGHIVEEGTHAELITDSQIYKNLWELQTSFSLV